MTRTNLAAALLAAVFTTLSVAAVAKTDPAPRMRVDQDAWNTRKKFVQLRNGLRVAYAEAGNPAGKPLLLLHGYTDTSRSWSLLVPHLSRYRLIMPDQRGHGATDAPECCYSPTQLASDAVMLLDALKIQRAAVAGHSMGSMVGMTMAAEHPDRLMHLVLIGSTALPPVKRGDWLYANATGQRFPVDRDSQFMRDWHPANQPTPVDAAFAGAAMEEIVAIRPHVWRSVLRELTDFPIGRHVADVKAPVLILSGGKDPLFPAEHHQALVKALPGAAARVFPGVGHNFHWELPDEVAAAIDAFVTPRR